MNQRPDSSPFGDRETYGADLERGLAVSGEGREYFAMGRLALLRERLQRWGAPAGSVLDFGCGDGSSAPLFGQQLNARRVTGVDDSSELLAAAVRHHGSELATFVQGAELANQPQFDLGYCNGVFHHIVPVERPAAARYVFERLLPGGLFAFWENNPWNPGTRWVMSRIEFDRDAIPVFPIEARELLRGTGFEVLETRYAFFFPGVLRWLRPLEAHLARIPLGAQYLVLARKPRADSIRK